MNLLRSEVAFGYEVASQRNGSEGGTVEAPPHHCRVWYGTVNRLPLTRELSPQVTEGENNNFLSLTEIGNNQLWYLSLRHGKAVPRQNVKQVQHIH